MAVPTVKFMARTGSHVLQIALFLFMLVYLSGDLDERVTRLHPLEVAVWFTELSMLADQIYITNGYGLSQAERPCETSAAEASTPRLRVAQLYQQRTTLR